MNFVLFYSYKHDNNYVVTKIKFFANGCYTPSQALNWWKAFCPVPKCWDYLSVWKLD